MEWRKKMRKLLRHLKEGIKRHPRFKNAKEQAALNYWIQRKRKEKTLQNSHFEFYYTEYFGFERGFYSGKRILDIGCGARGSLEWADMAERRVGLDPLADEYRKLEGDKHKMEYVKGCCEQLPFEDGSFDVVCAFNSFDHVDDLNTSIREIVRVVVPGGYFLLITDVHDKPTLREPQVFSWDVVKKFQTQCELLEEKHYEKSKNSRGIYEGVAEGTPFDHSRLASRYGILAAKFRKKTCEQ